MEIKNNADAPQLKFSWKKAFLVLLHFIVFLLTAFSPKFYTVEAVTRALP